MRLVVFGLTISSSWGNGHATLWRGLARALASRGHEVVFFERDVPYYAEHRDTVVPEGCDLHLYADWGDVRDAARREVAAADVAMITSYCPDAQQAARVVLDTPRAARVFYDMDTPVTLDALNRGADVDYVPKGGLGAFDLVLSFTGGRALDELQTRLGARRVAPLYGSVDPSIHRPVPADPALASDLSYLGTYARDRQATLDRLFFEPARRRPAARFSLAGSQYPGAMPWPDNVFYLRHLSPGEHAALYCSSNWTLNVTRGAMAAFGYCPSGRLFEAAACGVPIVTDGWEGLEHFFANGREVLVAATSEDVLRGLDMDIEERRALGRRARERALACHTAAARAVELEQHLEAIHVGHRTGSRAGKPDAAAGVFEGVAAGRQLA